MKRYWTIARALLLPHRGLTSTLALASRPTTFAAVRHWKRWASTEAAAAATSTDLTPAAFALRDYQEECIQAILDHQDQGHRRLGVSLATGSGKTVIFTQLIDRIIPLRPDATQTLILVHRRELVEQAAKHCRNHYPDKQVDIEMGSIHASGEADITVASIQSIISRHRINKFDPKKFKLILIDEVHHAVSKSYIKALDYFGAMSPESDVQLVGVSATFGRSDGVRLGAVIDHIVYHKDFVAMIDAGWLSQVLFTTVRAEIELQNVRIAGAGDFNLGELSDAVNTVENNDVIVRSWMEKAGNRKSTLVFCVDIAHVTDMTNTFRRYGHEAFFVTSETPLKERTQILEDFRAGKFPVLVNCGVYTEGTDIPNVDCVLLCRPTRSRTLLTQMIGRGMRLHPNKQDCHVIDVVGNIQRGVVTTPTLFGLSPDEVLDRAPSRMVMDKYKLENTASSVPQDVTTAEVREVDPEMYARAWDVTFVDYDSIHDLLDDTKAEVAVRQYSRNAWVWVSPGKYVLNGRDLGFVSVIAKEKGGFYATENRPLIPELRRRTGAPTMKPRTIMDHADTLEDAIHAIDTFVDGRYPAQLTRHAAAWRKAPASDGQLTFLAKRSKKTVEEYQEQGLTKGRAMDMLTRLKHGAQTLFNDLKVQKRKVERKKIKALKMSTPIMEEVKLGRLDADS
ncbi:hypothetical protein TWF696_007000 [Orbilia brochopaga]|uniref:Uncharacterized protein n=1 Tax=Orbilia brochopaga TaxID=3140254 RepID=A0AAV9URP3_9PEZI